MAFQMQAKISTLGKLALAVVVVPIFSLFKKHDQMGQDKSGK